MKFVCLAASILILSSARSAVARAEGLDCAHLRRANIVPCALGGSLAAKAETQGLESMSGRERAASVLLPSNPSLALGGGYTIDPSVRAPDREAIWSATLSQEP